MNLYLIGLNIALFITLVTSFFKRVSFHALGVGGLLGITIGISYYTHTYMLFQLPVVVFITWLTCYARLKENLHSPVEIFWGCVIGVIALLSVFAYAESMFLNTPF